MTDTVLILWLVGLAVVVGLIYFIPYWWMRKRAIHSSNLEVKAMSLALMEWLQQPKIVQSVIESGAFTHKQLQQNFEQIPWMAELQLRILAQKILTDRTTRRVVATHMEKMHGTDKGEVMKGLLMWAGVAA